MAKSQPTPLKREIRVFISSTFSDMQQERNYLVKKIFPDIERECKKRNVEFIALDLRWGITEEEAKRGKVVEICINEIDRTRPFFIGLLGGRYGWVPDKDDDFDPERISRNMPWIRPYLDSNISITELEMRYGVLDSKDPTHAHFFIRHDKDIPKKFRENTSANLTKLEKLKMAIRKAAEEGVCTVTDYGSVESLGKSVRKQLMRMIDELFPLNEALSVYDVYAVRQNQRIMELRRFHHSRIPELLTELKKHQRLLLSAGSSGAGLSAIAANEIPDNVAFEDLEGHRHHLRVIRTFVNTDVTTMEALKRMFVNALHSIYPKIDVSEINASIDETIDFEDIIARFPKEEYLWIVDSPENFPDEGDRNITELVKGMPLIQYLVIVSSDPKIIATCVNNHFYNRCVGSPTEKDLRLITTNYLRYYGKSLSERQISAITGSKILNNVKMLVTFLDILRNFGVYEDVDKFIHNFVSLDSPSDFYNRYFDYLEEEFSVEIVGEFFRRLQVIELGMSWKGLFKGLLKTQIEQSSFMSAVENLLAMRFHNCMLPKNSAIKEVVAARYRVGEKDYKRIANLIIEDYRSRMREITRDKRQSTLGRVFSRIFQLAMRGMVVLEDDSMMAEWGTLKAYTIILHARCGNGRKAIKMIRHFGYFTLIQYSQNEISSVFEVIRGKKIKYYSMFNSIDIIVGRYLLGNHTLVLIWNRLCDNDKDKALFMKKVKMKLLPPKMKKELLLALGNADLSTPIIKLWDENFDFENKDFDGQNYLTLLDQAPIIISYRSDDYVREILEKAQRTSSNMSSTNPMRIVFLRIILFCAVRLNDKYEYNEILTEIGESINSSSVQNDLRFADILFKLKNDYANSASVSNIIEKAKRLVDLLWDLSNDNGRFNILMCKIILMYYSVRDNVETYPKDELTSLLQNRGSIVEGFYFNNREDIAAFVLPAFLETKMSVADRVFYHRMYASSLSEIGDYGKAIAEYQKVLLTAEENNITRGSGSVEAILCEIIKCYMNTKDPKGFEIYATRFIEYAEKGKFECSKPIAFNRVSNGYNYLLPNFEGEAAVQRAREKVIEYSLRAYQEDPGDWVLWSNHIANLINHGGDLSARVGEMLPLIKEGKQLWISQLVSEESFIENLGKMFILAGMTDDFDKLLRKYPEVYFRSTLMENYSRLLHITPDKAQRQEYLSALIQHINVYVSNCVRKRKRIPVEFIMTVVQESGVENEIIRALLGHTEKAESSISDRMLAANIFRSLGNKERGDEVEREVAFYLLEGAGREDEEQHDIYALFQSECPSGDYEATRKYIVQRFVSADTEAQEQYMLKIDALYRSAKAEEYVEKAFSRKDECMRLLTDEVRLFIKNSQECNVNAFAQFCKLLNDKRKKGRQLSGELIQAIAFASEALIEAMVKRNTILNLNAWQVIADLLGSGKIDLGKQMVINGIFVTDAKQQYDIYKKFYSNARNKGDFSVAASYLNRLYEIKEFRMYEQILAEVTSKIKPEDELWPTLQVELCINLRRKGDYAAAMKEFERLNDYGKAKDKDFTAYIYILYPVTTSLLAGNYDEYHSYSDWVRQHGGERGIIEILNCAYLLKVDNFTTAERLYKLVRPEWNHKFIDTSESALSPDTRKLFGITNEDDVSGEDVVEDMDYETRQQWEELVALTAYRFIELSRYYLRHGETDEKVIDAYNTAVRLLGKIPESYQYFHNELSRLGAEIHTAKSGGR